MIDHKAIQAQHELDVYPKRDVVLVRGKNARVWDSHGREYIDCAAGHGVVSVGHCNEQVVAAITAQAQTLISCSGTFYNDKRAELLQRLVELSPASLVRGFLCNSGTETIEAAIKFARYSTGKSDFVCAVRGFHGRTIGAMSATHEPKYKDAFEPLVPGFSFVPFNNFERLASAVTDKTAGVILEIVQGEGGVNIGDRQFFECVAALCERQGVLLIIDEVQTGFCRTGKMFASEHFGLQPDILCLAKAIAGGLPMGAVLCSQKINAPSGKHGSTFGGNPLVCAAALAAIQFMCDQDLAGEAARKGAHFLSRFPAKNLPPVREVRQLGLMIGIELRTKAQPYLEQLLQRGVIALPAGPTVIRLLPPLTIPYEDIDTVVERLETVLQ